MKEGLAKGINAPRRIGSTLVYELDRNSPGMSLGGRAIAGEIMTEQVEEATWTGWSGETYKYQVYGDKPTMLFGAGNFIWACRNQQDERRWKAIYIGESTDLNEAFTDGTVFACAAKHGATTLHVHTHLGNDSARKREAKELRDLHLPPCNLPPKAM